MAGPYTILEHPSDVGVEARGSSLAEAFQHAAAGMMSVIVDPSRVDLRDTRTVTVRAADAEQLLVRWLSEVLYLYDATGFVGKEFAMTQWSRTALEAVVRGEPFSAERHRVRTDVKAVTYHLLLVEGGDQGGRVRFYLDI